MLEILYKLVLGKLIVIVSGFYVWNSGVSFSPFSLSLGLILIYGPQMLIFSFRSMNPLSATTVFLQGCFSIWTEAKRKPWKSVSCFFKFVLFGPTRTGIWDESGVYFKNWENPNDYCEGRWWFFFLTGRLI